jgi:hypothetical protein
MAIGTPVALGHGGTASSANSVSLTTGATVPSGALIIAAVQWYGSTFTASISGYTLAKTQAGTTDTNYRIAIFWFDAASGLAASSTITANYSPAAASNPMISACYVTGMNNASPVDVTGGTSTTGAGTGWSSGNVTTTNADDLLYTACGIDALRTSTPGGTDTEIQDFQNSGAATTQTAVYRIVAATGTYAETGTLSSSVSLERFAAIVAFKGTGGGGIVVPSEIATPRAAIFRSVR